MAVVIAGMTVSLDGFVADLEASPARLYPDLAELRGTDYMHAAIAQTGAVVMGRRFRDGRSRFLRRQLRVPGCRSGHRANNGINAFIEVTSRATFAVPPRAQRAYPHHQERTHT